MIEYDKLIEGLVTYYLDQWLENGTILQMIKGMIICNLRYSHEIDADSKEVDEFVTNYILDKCNPLILRGMKNG